MPLYALKLLSAIIERNPPLFTRQLRRTEPQLTKCLADFYQVGHPRLNRHTINILKSMIQSKELTLGELKLYRIGERTHQLLKASATGSVKGVIADWQTEILLDILHLTLAQLIEVVKLKEAEMASLIDDVLSSFDLCVQILGAAATQQFETQLVERASQCLILMLQLYALCTAQPRKREIYFNEGHVATLIAVLMSILGSTTAQQLSAAAQSDKKIIVKRILKCIYWALIQSEYQVRLKPDKRALLEQQVGQLI